MPFKRQSETTIAELAGSWAKRKYDPRVSSQIELKVVVEKILKTRSYQIPKRSRYGIQPVEGEIETIKGFAVKVVSVEGTVTQELKQNRNTIVFWDGCYKKANWMRLNGCYSIKFHPKALREVKNQEYNCDQKFDISINDDSYVSVRECVFDQQYKLVEDRIEREKMEKQRIKNLMEKEKIEKQQEAQSEIKAELTESILVSGKRCRGQPCYEDENIIILRKI